ARIASRSAHRSKTETPRDVGTFVVANAQSSKPIEPGERALHHPTPASQAAAVCGAALGQQRKNATLAQPHSDRRGIVTAVTHDTNGPTPPPSTEALQRWNGIHQRQCASSESLRFAPVRFTASGMPCASQITALDGVRCQDPGDTRKPTPAER